MVLQVHRLRRRSGFTPRFVYLWFSNRGTNPLLRRVHRLFGGSSVSLVFNMQCPSFRSVRLAAGLFLTVSAAWGTTPPPLVVDQEPGRITVSFAGIQPE